MEITTKINKTSYRQNDYFVSGGVISRISFLDTNPNSCFIFNKGLGNVYVSRKSNVNENNYELIIAGNSIQSFVKVIEYKELFLYSPIDTNVTIESFNTENLRPSDIPETQQIVFVNTSPITLGNIDEILSPVTVQGITNPVTVQGITNPVTVQGITNPVTVQGITNAITVSNVSDLVTLLTDIKAQNVTIISLLNDIKTNTTPV